MKEVEDYYDRLRLSPGSALRTGEKPRVFIATDDQDVISEAISQYPHFEIIARRDTTIPKFQGNRYSAESLDRVIVDTYLLSRSDYLVCTFSSHMCRLPYEIMQSRDEDMSDRYRSLDDVYYFDAQTPRLKEVTIDYWHPESGLKVAAGSAVEFKGNHWNGYSKVVVALNHTEIELLMPSFKLRDKPRTDLFPKYEYFNGELDPPGDEEK